MVRPILVDSEAMHQTRRWVGGALTCVGALGLLGSMRLTWFELRLFTDVAGGCCDRDIDNPHIGLTPWPSDSIDRGRPHLPGIGVYVAIVVVAVVALVAAAWITCGRARPTPTAYLVVGCGVAVGVLIAVSAALAFNVGDPKSYGSGVVVVRMAPLWGLLVGILGAFAIAGGGILVMLSDKGR